MSDPIEGLVLSRLLCGRESVGLSELRRSIDPIVRHRWSAAQWREVLAQTIDRLKASGEVEVSARGGVRLTKSGRERAVAFLEVPRSRVPSSWRAVRNALAAKAVGAPGTALSAEQLRCEIVARAHGLERKGRATESSLRNALTWKALGVVSERPVTRAAIQATLLGRLAGSDGGVDPRRAVSMLAAKAVGAKRSGAEDLKAATIRGLLERPLRSDSAPPAGLENPVAQARSADLSLFADRILAIARATQSDERFGTNKVFISHIWRTLERDGEKDREDFARRLIEANRLGHLRLSRADLVEAMDRSELAASEIAHENATFHFVRI